MAQEHTDLKIKLTKDSSKMVISGEMVYCLMEMEMSILDNLSKARNKVLEKCIFKKQKKTIKVNSVMTSLQEKVKLFMETETPFKEQCLKIKRMDQESISTRKKIRCKRVVGKWMSDKVNSPNFI